MTCADIKAAAQRGLVNMETMAKALEGDARCVAWTQWLIDGNDGPQSPPERWRAEVTVESLTDAVRYWKDGTKIVEFALARAIKADPADSPFPLVGVEAATWHHAQATAYQHALEMMGWTPSINARREGSK